MSVATAVSVAEYLNTTYRPDCDYLEGELLERNVGELDHSRLQTLISVWLGNREKQSGIFVLTEMRVQVKSRRFRVPDVLAVKGGRPATRILTEPPFLCIEILSPEDSFAEMQERIDDYLAFGVRYVWVINPKNRKAFIYSANSIHEAKDGVLTTTDPDIRLNLAELE
ncbi:MAG TPA: Uma2 family endonuclease [Bryobacteraceae bacterium]|nr:Uma2 family endonuclease [Bryobacteraceae bacterium]